MSNQLSVQDIANRIFDPSGNFIRGSDSSEANPPYTAELSTQYILNRAFDSTNNVLNMRS